MNDRDYMNLAINEAKLAVGEVPVGCVIIKDDKVIASAHNEQVKRGDPLAHAEMLALGQAREALNASRLTGATLFVTLEPCPMCAGALIMSGVERCVFAAFDTQYGCCGSVYALPMDPVFHHRVACEGGLLQEEAQALLDGFFLGLRAKKA